MSIISFFDPERRATGVRGGHSSGTASPPTAADTDTVPASRLGNAFWSRDHPGFSLFGFGNPPLTILFLCKMPRRWGRVDVPLAVEDLHRQVLEVLQKCS